MSKDNKIEGLLKPVRNILLISEITVLLREKEMVTSSENKELKNSKSVMPSFYDNKKIWS